MDFLHTISPADLGVFALGLIIAGAVSGLAAGTLGIGGGIVIVPVLYHVMSALGIDAEVRMHVAIGTSLAAMIPAALAHVQNEKREINWAGVQTQAIPLVIGIALGCAAAASSGARALTVMFALVAIPVLFHLLFEPKPAAKISGSRAVLMFTAICASLSVLSGIAMDTIRRCVLGRWQGDADRNRAASSVLTLIAAIAGAFALAIVGWNAPDLPPYSLGYVNLLGFALIAPVLLATEPAGAALADMMDLRRLRLVFAGLVVITTARMLWDAFV